MRKTTPKGQLVKIHTKIPYYGSYSSAKCAKPTLDKTYVRILALCVEPKTRREIYPNAKNIFPDQLYALENGGFLQRLTEKRYANFKYGPKISWWQTTEKGLKIVAAAVNAKFNY